MSPPRESLWNFFWRAPFVVRIWFMVLFAIALVILAGSGWTVKWLAQKEKWLDRKPKEEATKAPVVVEPFTLIYEIKSVSIHLTSRRRSRVAYAQFTLVLDCADQACLKTMQLNRAKLLDRIYEVGNRFYIEDFQLTTGFQNFKAQLKSILQEEFLHLAPRDLAIRDWLLS